MPGWRHAREPRPETPSGPCLARVAPEDYAAAARRIAPYVRRTPLLTVRVDGRKVSLKLEHLQAAGVFKIRGALNALLATRREGGRRDAVRWSPRPAATTGSASRPPRAGWASPRPSTSRTRCPDIKASRIAAAGADVVKTGRVYADAERAAREFAAGQGLYYVHAYDDPAVVAGQGTLAAGDRGGSAPSARWWPSPSAAAACWPASAAGSRD